MRLSSSGRHDDERAVHCLAVGAVSVGSVASAAAISSRERPTRWAAPMNPSRRRTSRRNRRCPPLVRVDVMRPARLVEPDGRHGESGPLRDRPDRQLLVDHAGSSAAPPLTSS